MDDEAKKGGQERSSMSRDELWKMAEMDARSMLGVSAEKAFEKLERGELAGKLSEAHFRKLHALLKAES
jgi:hypothetical protein